MTHANVLHRSFMMLAMAFAMLTLVGCGGSSPDSTVKAFYNALASGDTEGAKKYLDPDDLKGEQGQMAAAMLGKVSGLIKEAGGIKSMDIVSSTVNGDQATVKVKVTLKNDQAQEDEMKLVNKDGWKIKM